jgi:hypothetical protein
MLHALRFSLQNAVYLIMLPLLVPVLFTFYIESGSVVKQKGMVFGFQKTATAVVGPVIDR